MIDLSLKYNQDFKHCNIVEDIFKDTDGAEDENALNLNNRNSGNYSNDNAKHSLSKKKKIIFILRIIMHNY